jgi:hypothetical protein
LSTERFPELRLDAWEETKITLHLFAQIVGKVRARLSPKLNHWWHVPFYVSARGLTTCAIPCRDGNFEMEFDVVDHQLVLRTSSGRIDTVSLEGVSVAGFYEAVMDVLRGARIDARIVPKPFDPGRVGSDIPFAEDVTHASYDRDCVRRFWRALVGIESIFREFRGRFLGKCSPVHFFWHSFDLAVTRFSGRPAAVATDADPVTREAYSHEVISAGFWAGDQNMREPAFYTYVHPEPPGLAEQRLRPAAAWWQSQNGGSMALYRYDDFRHADDPRGALLAFLESAYEAGAALADWPRAELERRA